MIVYIIVIFFYIAPIILVVKTMSGYMAYLLVGVYIINTVFVIYYSMWWDRVIYKAEWCLKHFPNEHIANDCFLCEYAYNNYISNCNKCPIRWTTEDNDDAVTTYCCYDNYYYNTPISEILALPERELRKEN